MTFILETEIMESHSCNGDNKVFYPKFSADYSKPFVLSMTIMTKPECNGCEGSIFSDQDDPNRIGILWTSSGKLDIQIGNRAVQKDTSALQQNNQLRIKSVVSETLTINKKYDVSITFDGSKCKVYLNDALLGQDVDCSSGFGGMRSNPYLCNNFGGGWNGLIENLRFGGTKVKGTYDK